MYNVCNKMSKKYIFSDHLCRTSLAKERQYWTYTNQAKLVFLYLFFIHFIFKLVLNYESVFLGKSQCHTRFWIWKCRTLYVATNTWLKAKIIFLKKNNAWKYLLLLSRKNRPMKVTPHKIEPPQHERGDTSTRAILDIYDYFNWNICDICNLGFANN